MSSKGQRGKRDGLNRASWALCKDLGFFFFFLRERERGRKNEKYQFVILLIYAFIG